MPGWVGPNLGNSVVQTSISYILNVICLAILLFHAEKGYSTEKEILQFKKVFWKRIFSIYTSNEVVIHDAERPWIILGVAKKEDSNKQYKKIKSILENRTKTNREYRTRISKIYEKYGVKNLANVRMRMQRGMKDDLEIAIKRSAKIIEYIDRKIQINSLPRIVRYIPFIESMFNNDAVSPKGAVGMWQFIASTAKQYQLIKNGIDYRRDPYRSTDAAMRILNDYNNYFENWPLAITAYNQGIGRMSKVIRETGTRDLAEIIEGNHKDIGFAGRNYYAELMAISEIVESRYRIGVL